MRRALPAWPTGELERLSPGPHLRQAARATLQQARFPSPVPPATAPAAAPGWRRLTPRDLLDRLRRRFGK